MPAAAAASQTLAIVNDATGDHTVLVDDFKIAPWSPVAPGQVLQWAPDATGPWIDIVGAPNPYTTTTTESQRYYRIEQ